MKWPRVSMGKGADIRTFKRIQLDRLFYPVVVLDYDFSKAYYARISEKGELYGRVKREASLAYWYEIHKGIHESLREF